MSPIILRSHMMLILAAALVGLLSACSSQNSQAIFDPQTGKHPATWLQTHPASFLSNPSQCTECHGADLHGGISNVSCFSASFGGIGCHANGPGHADPATWALPAQHGTAAKAAPNAAAMHGFSICQLCHGSNFAGDFGPTCLNTAGCHGVGVMSPHPVSWSSGTASTYHHNTTDPGNGPVCALCHTAGANSPVAPPPAPAPGTPPGCFNNTLCHGQLGHAPGWANPNSHGAAAKSAPNVAAMQGFSTCQTCHGSDFTGSGSAVTCLNTAGCHGATVGAPHSFPWQSTSARKHSTTDPTNASACGLCHLANRQPPAYVPLTVPVGCFDNTLCHGAVANLGCVDCHSSVQNAPNASLASGGTVTQRDAVVGEFGLAWGHKKSGRGAVTNADCIVCHLEGNYATQARSAYHGDGNIDLRDPDGAGETPITNISGGAFTFTKFATSYAAGSRTSTGQLSNSVDNVLTQKFCVACHDSNGATNPTARSGAGTQYMPFGGINMGANYTVANGAAAAGGLVDVKTQFATTNSSYHPVLGPLNRDFPLATRLLPPYDNQVAGRVAAGGVKTNSVVLNCFDCHNTPTTPLTTRTVAAHGNAVSLRGTVYVSGAASTLCTTCHTPYTTTGTHGAAGSGTAWTTTGTSHNVSRDCQYCHGSQTGTARSVRPLGAQDYHGNNSLVGGGLWPTVNSRPYAFIRGWSGGAYHRPFRSTEFSTGNATCGAGTCPSGAQVGDGSTRTYTPGGSY
jgi:hypothetical protein